MKTILTSLLFILLLFFSQTAIGNNTKRLHPLNSKGKVHLLVVGKAYIIDAARKQKIAAAAVHKIANAAKKSNPEIVVDAVAESIMTKQQYLRGEVKEKVTGAIFKKRLVKLAETVTAQDTVIIYTHSHGRRAGFEALQPLGGIVINLPKRDEHRGTFLWDEYSELLLKIPAKNVVVLTMSCFSGGFVEHLNSPKIKARWERRHKKQGRNLIILTSQKKTLPSGPIVKRGEIINPFTYAVAKMLAGDADGFKLVNGKPSETLHKDGKLTVGEMIDYVLYTTENTTSEKSRIKNTAKPQLTGSFDRRDILRFGTR